MLEDLNGGGAGGEGSEGGENGDDLGAAIHAAAGGGEGGDGEGGDGAGAGGENGEGGEGAGEGGGEGGAAAGDHKPLTPQEQRAMAQELSEIRAWRVEQEQSAAAAKEKPATKEAPKPMTDQEFSQLEARAGFIRSKVKNETTGEMEDRMSIDPRKQLEFMSGMMEHGLARLEQRFEAMLHDNVSSLRRQDLFSEMEKDPSKEFADIKQYSKAISDILVERYVSKDRTNRKYVASAFYEAKGRGLKDLVKKIENKQELHRRVIHPGSGNGKPGGGAGGGAARPAGTVAAAFLDKFDPAPAGKK